MGAGVMVRTGLPRRMVHADPVPLALDDAAAANRDRMHVQALDGDDRVSNLRVRRGPDQLALIPELAAALAITRRVIEHQFDLLAFPRLAHPGTVLENREH